MKNKPTPRPWQVIEDGENDPYIIEANVTMQNFGADPVCYIRNVENAAHIVKCVNMHDELIAFVVQCLEFGVMVPEAAALIAKAAEAGGE